MNDDDLRPLDVVEETTRSVLCSGARALLVYVDQLAAGTRSGEVAPGAATKKRGRQATAPDPRDKRIVELERQNAKLTTRAEGAEAIAEIQKKVAALLGRPCPSEES